MAAPTDWYVDQSGGNDTTGDGSSGNPYLTITKVDTVAAADDRVFVKNNSAAGTTATLSKALHIRGCNSSFVQDGTRPIIDATGVTNAILLGNTACDGASFSNMEWSGATGDGLEGVAGVLDTIFFRCVAHDNGGSGFGYPSTSTVSRNAFVLCASYNNTGQGFVCSTQALVLYCASIGNGSGMNVSTAGCAVGCVDSDSAGLGYVGSINARFIGCRSYGSGGTSGMTAMAHGIVFGCRVSDAVGNGINLSGADDASLRDWNVAIDNGTDINTADVPRAIVGGNGTTAGIPGWKNAAGDDLTVLPTGALFNQQMVLLDGINDEWLTPGYSPEIKGGEAPAEVDPVVIHKVSKEFWDTDGGETVTLTVQNASATGNTVKSGGALGTECTIQSESETTIVVTTPAGTVGRKDLYVITAAGSAFTWTDGIQYLELGDNSPIGEYFKAIEAKLQDNSTVATTDSNIIIGETIDLLGLNDDKFPRIENSIEIIKGAGYAAQRDIDFIVRHHVVGYIRRDTDSYDFDDLVELCNFGIETRTFIYGMLDDKQNGNSPCNGFLKFEGFPLIYYDFELIPKISVFIIEVEAHIRLTDTQTR